MVLLQYEGEEPSFAKPRHGLADLPNYGLRNSDTSCHYPLVVCILPGHLRGAPRARLHRRSAAAKALRQKAKRSRQNKHATSCASDDEEKNEGPDSQPGPIWHHPWPAPKTLHSP